VAVPSLRYVANVDLQVDTTVGGEPGNPTLNEDTVDYLIMHSSMHYEITTKSIQLFAESVQNPNMHYENFYAL
jgi:hypothetical protein